MAPTDEPERLSPETQGPSLFPSAERRWGANSLDRVAREIASKYVGAPPRPPVMLRPILDRLDVPFVLERDPDAIPRRFAGQVVVRDARLTIRMRRRDLLRAPQRSRFTIAHELAHVLLTWEFGGEPAIWASRNRSNHKRVERLCDQIASHILLPRRMLQRHLLSGSIADARHVDQLSCRFDVSRRALLTGICGLLEGGVGLSIRKFRHNDSSKIEWRVYQSHVPYPHPAYIATNSSSKHYNLGVEIDSIAEPTRIDVATLTADPRGERYEGLAVRWFRDGLRPPNDAGPGALIEQGAGEIFVALTKPGRFESSVLLGEPLGRATQ